MSYASNRYTPGTNTWNRSHSEPPRAFPSAVAPHTMLRAAAGPAVEAVVGAVGAAIETADGFDVGAGVLAAQKPGQAPPTAFWL